MVPANDDYSLTHEPGTGYEYSMWIGEEVDYYFGGIFGRGKDAPADQGNLFTASLGTVHAFV